MNGPDAFSHLYELIKQDRMEALRYVSEGVSQQMIDPLSAIKGRAEKLRAQLSVEQQRGIDVIISEIDKLVDFVEDFSSVLKSDPGVLIKSEVNLRSLTDFVVNFLRHRLVQKQIACRVEVPQNLNLSTDSARLQQVMMSIIVNAIEAVEDAILKRKDGPRALVIETRHDDSKLIISISDTGCGMSPEVANRVFEPMFSTKKRFSGKGIGLSMANKYVNELGGRLTFYTQEGVGSTFEIELPV